MVENNNHLMGNGGDSVCGEKGLTTFEKRKSEGCCGFFDTTIIINGKLAKIGCNFGH